MPFFSNVAYAFRYILELHTAMQINLQHNNTEAFLRHLNLKPSRKWTIYVFYWIPVIPIKLFHTPLLFQIYSFICITYCCHPTSFLLEHQSIWSIQPIHQLPLAETVEKIQREGLPHDNHRLSVWNSIRHRLTRRVASHYHDWVGRCHLVID